MDEYTDDVVSSESQSTARTPIEWETHEYVHVEKAPEWYWAFGLIIVAGSVTSLLYENILFAVFILIAGFVLALFATRQPNVCRFAVTQRGVRINDKLYPYKTFEWFAIDEPSPDHTPKLILNPTHFFSPIIVIPLVDVDPDEIHDYLGMFLEDKDHVEPFSHRAMEWLGF